MSFLKWLPRLGRRAPSIPRLFSNQSFERVPEDQKIEEETCPGYVAARYYPVRIGDVFQSRYQVVGKLGFGAFSTVWLARDLNFHRHVALKVFVRHQSMGSRVDHELNMYKQVEQGSSTHPGRTALRTLLDSFELSGPDGKHHCLVHPPLWDDLRTYLARNPIGRLPTPVLGIVMQRLLLALDYLHNECHLIHTDIKADNIMFGIEDNSVFERFEEQEIQNPTPRKEIGGRFIYVSRDLDVPTDLGPPVLCDLGSAVSGGIEHLEDVQPDVYRSPEVILGIPWSYKIDIWNAGCMVWDIYEDRHLFYGKDPEHGKYRGRAHLAEMIALIGPPPPEFVARGRHKGKFFSDEGAFNADIDLPPTTCLGEIETNLQGKEKELFLSFMKKLLQWEPEKRSSAEALLSDPWFRYLSESGKL